MGTAAFTERVLTSLASSTQTLVLVADSKWGVPYLFEALREREASCIWLKLGPEDEDDPVAQGNKLADAVARALGSPLFGHGMPYGYGLNLLKQHLGLLEPLSLLLSGADYGQKLASDLLALQQGRTRVLLHFEALPTDFLIPDDARLWQAEDLRLSEAEALELAAGRLGEVEAKNLWRLSRGAYERFLLALHERLSLPPPLRPGPEGSEVPPASGAAVPPPVLLGVLTRRSQWLEALELAVTHLPERVPELLAQAGEAYLERGLYRRLFDLLAQLGPPVADDEAVLTWQLRAAKRLGNAQALRPRIEAHLAEHEAPDLRAIYATTLSGEAGFREVERAYRAARTATTLQHYGLYLTYEDPEASLAVFQELLELSRRENAPGKRVLAAMMSAPPLILLGRYREAAQWLEEGLTRFDQHGLGDWQARMYMVSTWSYLRILIGETVGLGEILHQEARALQGAFPALALSFRSTLGDYLLSQGRACEALAYYQENLDVLNTGSPTQGRDLPPHIVRDVVHCLLHLGQNGRAGYLAQKHYRLARASEGPAFVFAQLSHGMVLALEQPDEAVDVLEAVRAHFEASLSGDYLASSSFYLARAYLALGERERALQTLEQAEHVLRELSDTGFRLLAGPEAAFREVYKLWRDKDIPLQLQFLGEGRVTLEGEPLRLFPQWQDVLALLASHPEGLSSEQLLLELYGDDGSVNSLKATLSKLRRHLPISRPPYRLELPFQADFLELEAHLRQGRIRAGLELYRGPLLPRSQAPGVVRLRETLEEVLRQAVLTSGDPEALLSLAEQLGDDPELWEAALATLPKQDPRHSLALARHKKVLESW